MCKESLGMQIEGHHVGGVTSKAGKVLKYIEIIEMKVPNLMTSLQTFCIFEVCLTMFYLLLTYDVLHHQFLT